MELVDVHAHMDHPTLSVNVDSMIKKAAANGVVTILAAGINHESNQKVLELAEKYELIQATLGLYPSEFSNVTLNEGFTRATSHNPETTLAFIEENIEKCVALGEVGMDFKESDDSITQKQNFRKIVQLAKKHRKPLIIHSRKAESAVLDVLEEEDYRRVVMHCFMGRKSVLKRGINMGLYFSIPPAVVRVQQFQQNVEEIPIGQLLTETDTPWLGVEKDLPSEPAQVRDAVKKIAEIKRVEVEECAQQLYFNYQKLFQ